MKFLLHTSKTHFRWLLYLKKKYYNEKRKKQLEKNNYEFVDINEFKKLRNFDEFNNFKWNKNHTTDQICTKNNEILSITERSQNRKRSYSEMMNN